MGWWDALESIVDMMGSIVNPIVRVAMKPMFWLITISIVVISFVGFLLWPALRWSLIKILGG